MTEKEYANQLREIENINQQKRYLLALKKAQRHWRPKKEKKETSKKLVIYLFVLMNVVICYCLVSMWYFRDLSCLGIIITDIAAQILAYAIYCVKAYKAKQSQENLKFEKEKWEDSSDFSIGDEEG